LSEAGGEIETKNQRLCFICLKEEKHNWISQIEGKWVNADGSVHTHIRPCIFGCGRLVRPNNSLTRYVNEDDGKEHACEGYLRSKGIKIKVEINLDYFSDAHDISAKAAKV
jgi:hypothetical protein